MKRRFAPNALATALLLLLATAPSLAAPRAQSPDAPQSDADPAGLGDRGEVARLQAALDLTSPYTVMCVACHPDDEDGATLTIERRRYGARTVTLFSTSGEGGQNAVGPELYAELGRIRERETREAAEIQGSQPYFLRLPDFGFSKSGDEAMRVWDATAGGHDRLVELYVAAIRALKPNVIITNHDTTSGHGQHQATGRLLLEAYMAAADPAKFPNAGAPWSPAALYVRSVAEDASAIAEDAGAYDSIRGLTYREEAFRALLRHATQGPWKLSNVPRFAYYKEVFGPAGAPAAGASGGARVDAPAGPGSPLTRGVAKAALPRGVAAASPRERRAALAAMLADRSLAPWMRDRAEAALAALLGASVDLRLDGPDDLVPGSKVTATLSVSNGGDEPFEVTNLTLLAPRFPFEKGDPNAQGVGPLAPGERRSVRLTLSVPDDPTVLDASAGTSAVERVVSSSVPTDHEPGAGVGTLVAAARVRTGAAEVTASSTRYVHVVSPVAVVVSPPRAAAAGAPSQGAGIRIRNFSSKPVAFALPVDATPRSGGQPGRKFSLAPGAEEAYDVALDAADRVTNVEIREDAPSGRLLARVEVGAVRGDVRVAPGLRVGYVRSYEFSVPNALESLGVEHAELTPEAVRDGDLSRFDTIVVDNRAYLKYPDLARYNVRLLEYVRNGGNLVVFYHKAGEYDPSLAPYPITVGRERITDENAPVEILAASSPLLSFPNRIDAADFAGWIQERGLYYPSAWDGHYTALLSSHDPGEKPLTGGLLVAPYGKGTFVYTSYVWYRQLRGFVPGGYRVFANMISLPKAPK